MINFLKRMQKDKENVSGFEISAEGSLSDVNFGRKYPK